MSVNPILKAAFRNGDWHDSLCAQLWSIAEQQPSAANLKLALDASHCIEGVDESRIEQVDDLIKDRRLTSWPLFFRLCSFDIAANRTDRLQARLEQYVGTNLGFRQRRALTKFPRVLDYLNQHHHPLLNRKLFKYAGQARGLLVRCVTIGELLEELGIQDSAKRVALVGNGPSLESKAAGADIDAHDIVIRFNNTGVLAELTGDIDPEVGPEVDPEGDPDIGSKTALWVVSPGLNFDTVRVAANQCAVTGPDPWTRASRYWTQVAMQAVTHIATFDLHRWHFLVKELSAPPSAGLLMIDALRQAGVGANAMTTYGFSRLEELNTADGTSKDKTANHYRDDAARSDRHNWSREAMLYRRWS